MKGREFEELKELLKHHYRVINHLQAKHLKETGQAFIPAFVGQLDDAEAREIDEIILQQGADA